MEQLDSMFFSVTDSTTVSPPTTPTTSASLPTTPTTSAVSNSDDNTVKIIAITIGVFLIGILLVVVIVIAVALWIKRRKFGENSSRIPHKRFVDETSYSSEGPMSLHELNDVKHYDDH